MNGSVETQILSISDKKATSGRLSGVLSIALAPVLSGALLVLAFPRHDLTWLVWVGLVPLFLAISGRSPKFGFFISYVCGIVFYAGVFAWAFEIPGYRVHHHAILAICFGAFFAVFGLVFNSIAKRWALTTAYLTAPFVWVSIEYLKCNLFFLALPWPLLAHSQYQHPLIIQFASITGAYGVSFLIVMINSALAIILLPLVCRQKNNGFAQNQLVSNTGRNTVIGLAALLSALAILYGDATLERPLSEKTIKLSVLQGNIDQEMKRNPRKHAAPIMQRYVELTRQAAEAQPDLIVWPEASTPGLVLKHLGLHSQLRRLIREVKTHLLVGSSEFPKFDKALQKRGKAGNTALFFSPEGKVLAQHLKTRLLPFGEYIPYEDTFPWPEFIVPNQNQNWEIPGREYTLFELDTARFGVIICWENAFPALVRQFVKEGANLMINITNEGWFGDSAAPYQFLAMSVFRSVENRVSMARAANTGISCFIDPYGRVTDRVWSNNKDIYVSGYLTRDIILSEKKTFYTRYGDVFTYLSILITAVAVALCFRKDKKQ
jgi:apolipoprotein N-acyltransferase